MRIAAALQRVPARLAFWALAGAALFVSHDAIFFVQLGPGESLTHALRDAGHEYWAVASLALAGFGIAAAVGAWVRLHRLRRRAAELGAASGRAGRARILPTWLRLFAVIALGFVIQENVEHYISHMHATGLGVLLGPEYPLALPVIGLISGVAAMLASAVSGIERELLASIAAALRRPLGRAPRALLRPPTRRSVVRISLIAEAIAGRAPPRAFVPQT